MRKHRKVVVEDVGDDALKEVCRRKKVKLQKTQRKSHTSIFEITNSTEFWLFMKNFSIFLFAIYIKVCYICG